MNCATRQLPGVSTLPGMWTMFAIVRPETSMPRIVPSVKLYDSTDRHSPPSGSSPTQHGQRTPHVHTSSSVPVRS